MSDDRVWYPADYVDEICPPGRPSPDHWIVQLDDGAPCIDHPDDDEPMGVALKDGDVVEFTWSARAADLTLTVHADGTWALPDLPPEPANGELVYRILYDNDTVTTDPATWFEDGIFDLEVGDHEVEVTAWSLSDISFRFSFAEQRFMPVMPVDANWSGVERDGNG